ncbi:MAG: DUF6390 family protein, partial [Candidatus Micrarchaeota archaeon]
KGAELAARYAYPPNSCGYCGNKSFRGVLKRNLQGAANSAALEKELAGFRAHHLYLSLIARENEMEPFDMEVVRALWTGNRLLENVPARALRDFMERELFPPAKAGRARALADALPRGLLPHHSFNVLYVNFVTDAAERSMASYDSCCVTSAKVLSVSGRFADVLRRSISFDRGFSFRPRLEVVEVERKGIRLAGELAEGDSVAVHWGMVVERLGRAEAAALEKYTRINMEALNRAGTAPRISRPR